MGLSHLTLPATNLRIDLDASGLPTDYAQQHWYAVYTCANQEKRVASEIEARGVEHFLPVYRSVRR